MELFKKKKAESIIWGLRVPLVVRDRWQTIAGIMGVPTNRLVNFILTDWARKNQNTLLDETLRARLTSRINKTYLEGKLN
ncbi:hypothetical protein ACFLWU_03485 [Chloroflexota bacterium]